MKDPEKLNSPSPQPSPPRRGGEPNPHTECRRLKAEGNPKLEIRKRNAADVHASCSGLSWCFFLQAGGHDASRREDQIMILLPIGKGVKRKQRWRLRCSGAIGCETY